MLRSMGKKSGESVESIRKQKEKLATVGTSTNATLFEAA